MADFKKPFVKKDGQQFTKKPYTSTAPAAKAGATATGGAPRATHGVAKTAQSEATPGARPDFLVIADEEIVGGIWNRVAKSGTTYQALQFRGQKETYAIFKNKPKTEGEGTQTQVVDEEEVAY